MFKYVSQALLILLACGLGAEGALRAGAYAEDITPKIWPVHLAGSFEARPSERAHDPLHARALVLDDGRTKVAIVVVDSCYVPRSIFDDAKRIAAKATGIRVDHMMMSATHTHSAPHSLTRRGIQPSEGYPQLLTKGIAESVRRAAANLQPAKIGWGSAQVPEELFNRRWFVQQGKIPPNPFGGTTDKVQMNPGRGNPHLIKPAGPVDPQVSFVSVTAADGKPLALLANYSLHYVGPGTGNTVSADYFGEFARQIAKRLAPAGGQPAFVGIMSNGTSGDVNNIDFRVAAQSAQPFERVTMVSNRVADAVFDSYKKIQHRNDWDLAMAEREITLGVRKPTPAEVEQARKFLAGPDESKLPRRAKQYAAATLRLAEHPDTVDIKLQALRIGEVGIAAIPCEVFTETGLEIKAKSPLKASFTIELANGYNGYLPTPEQHALGGYETWRSDGSYLEVNASRIITTTVLELLRSVAKGR